MRPAIAIAGAALAYCVVTFPVSLLLGFHGDVWAMGCLLYGLICGAVGVHLGFVWEDRRVSRSMKT